MHSGTGSYIALPLLCGQLLYASAPALGIHSLQRVLCHILNAQPQLVVRAHALTEALHRHIGLSCMSFAYKQWHAPQVACIPIQETQNLFLIQGKRHIESSMGPISYIVNMNV